MNTLQAHGFTLWDMGGNCKAWGKHLANGRELLVTTADGSSPDVTVDDWGVGLYENGGEVMFLTSPDPDLTLQSAIDSLARWR